MNIHEKTMLHQFCESYLLCEFNTLKKDEKDRIVELFIDFIKLHFMRKRMIGNARMN